MTSASKSFWWAPLLLAVWLVMIATGGFAVARPSPVMLPSSEAPRHEPVGCKLQGANLVCDGKLLQNRLKRPRLKGKEKPKASATKSKPAKSQATKSQPSKSGLAKSQGSKGSAPTAKSKAGTPTPEQREEADESQSASAEPEEDQASEKESSGPSAEPDAKEAAKSTEPPNAAAPPVPTAAPAPVVTTPPKEQAPDASSQPAMQAGASAPQVETCCSARAIDRASGLPLSGDGNFSLCGASEQDAKAMLPAVADLKNYLLAGDIDCAPK